MNIDETNRLEKIINANHNIKVFKGSGRDKRYPPKQVVQTFLVKGLDLRKRYKSSDQYIGRIVKMVKGSSRKAKEMT